MTASAILVLNAGSSSVKFAVYEAPEGPPPLARWRGQVEGVPGAPTFTASEDGRRIVSDQPIGAGGHAAALRVLLEWVIARVGRERLAGAGHRVVHGGAIFTAPTLIDADGLEALESLVPLAPLHQPHNVAGVRAVAEIAPGLPQVACFDTSFHQSAPAVATTIALPQELREAGLRRYGFHGISYSFIAGRLADHLPEERRRRVVVAHLGNGASLCALRDGAAVDTTMSFSALDGLLMGTRAGALDPGVLLFLMREHGYDAARLEDLLYKRSGLLGLSGVSADMRALMASEAPEARLAIDQFVYRIVRETGAMASILGGLDALVFTAGIGERAAAVRRRVVEGLGWLGLDLDAAANDAHQTCISTSGSKATALVLPTDEELMIAQETLALTREPAPA